MTLPFTLTCIPHINYDAKNRRLWITEDRESQTIDCFFDPCTIRTLLQVAESVECLLTKRYQQSQQASSITKWFAGSSARSCRITIKSIVVCGKAYDRQAMEHCDTFSTIQDEKSFIIRCTRHGPVSTRRTILKSLRQKFVAK